jgi:hypothetical protein
MNHLPSVGHCLYIIAGKAKAEDQNVFKILGRSQIRPVRLGVGPLLGQMTRF